MTMDPNDSSTEVQKKRRTGRGGPRRKKGSVPPIEVNIDDVPSVLVNDSENVIMHLRCSGESGGGKGGDGGCGGCDGGGVVDGGGDRDPESAFGELPDAYNHHGHAHGLEFSQLSESIDLESVKLKRKQEIEYFNYQRLQTNRDIKTSTPSQATSVQLLSDFFVKSKSSDWPTSTSVCCHWCCHGFDTVPVGLPMKYSDGVYHVTHCFCSFNCAMAFNINDTRDSIDERLMRNSMINSIAVLYGHAGSVRPAPSRYALRVFGGSLTIDEFRSFTTKRTIENGGYLVPSVPPMQSMKEYMEELTDVDVVSDYHYIPIDKERVKKYQTKLKLMRSKPLVKYNNTLDHTMNLKYVESSACVET